MEFIRGKQTSFLSAGDFTLQAKHYAQTLLDIGTGDGRFVLKQAQTKRDWLVVGLDSCRENLKDTSRKAPANALFAIGCAFNLPPELENSADLLTLNFPWGSLLEGLLGERPGLYEQLRRVARPTATLEVRLNSSALEQFGYGAEDGVRQIRQNMQRAGLNITHLQTLSEQELRLCPTTWAKRLAFGGLAVPGHLITARL